MGDWYHSVERQRRDNERQEQENLIRERQQSQVNNIQAYRDLKQIADALGIPRKLRDIANMVGGTTAIKETPNYQEGITSGSRTLTYSLEFTVPTIEVVYSQQTGTAPIYHGHGQAGGNFYRTELVRPASRDYKPSQPIYCQRGTRNAVRNMQLRISGQTIDVDFVSQSFSITDDLGQITTSLDSALHDWVDSINNEIESAKENVESTIKANGSLPIR